MSRLHSQRPDPNRPPHVHGRARGCKGYENCCVCPACVQREQGVKSGRFYYDQRGHLRVRRKPSRAALEAARLIGRPRELDPPEQMELDGQGRLGE